jgi:hypothetical protein
LKHATVLFRHGARAAAHPLPTTSQPPTVTILRAGTPLSAQPWTDAHHPAWEWPEPPAERAHAAVPVTGLATSAAKPHNDYDEHQLAQRHPGGHAFGQLTAQGRRDAYHLGALLRRRYVERLALLPAQPTGTEVACRSTNFTRTIETARGVLAGLAPGEAAAAATLRIEVAPMADDELVPSAASCPRLHTLFQRDRHAMAAPREDVQRAAAELAAALGVAKVSLVALADHIQSGTYHGYVRGYEEGELSLYVVTLTMLHACRRCRPGSRRSRRRLR